MDAGFRRWFCGAGFASAGRMCLNLLEARVGDSRTHHLHLFHFIICG